MICSSGRRILSYSLSWVSPNWHTGLFLLPGSAWPFSKLQAANRQGIIEESRRIGAAGSAGILDGEEPEIFRKFQMPV